MIFHVTAKFLAIASLLALTAGSVLLLFAAWRSEGARRAGATITPWWDNTEPLIYLGIALIAAVLSIAFSVAA